MTRVVTMARKLYVALRRIISCSFAPSRINHPTFLREPSAELARLHSNILRTRGHVSVRPGALGHQQPCQPHAPLLTLSGEWNLAVRSVRHRPCL